MSALQVQQPQKNLITWTPEQHELIKSTVAKGATNDELKLFLYRAQQLGLDPLKPGQIYFIKYGSSPGTIVIGIDGFRSKAGSTGKHCGTKRGVLRDDKGKCIGAWCEVFRSDWREPAREEVSLLEYTTGKAMWAKMPETMIKKVAEAAALRMAFADDLGGVYAEEEMHQAEPKDVTPKVAAVAEPIAPPLEDVLKAKRAQLYHLVMVDKKYQSRDFMQILLNFYNGNLTSLTLKQLDEIIGLVEREQPEVLFQMSLAAKNR